MSGHRAAQDLFNALLYPIPDPGASGTITIDRQLATVEVTTAAAEVRTLDTPTRAGTVALVVFATDGGDLTLTVTDGYNADGDTSITFADAGDFVAFVSVQVGTACVWRVLAQEGTNAAMETLSVDSLTVGGSPVGLADMTPGSGTAGTGTIIEHSVVRVGGLYRTTILVDLTGLNSGDADGDIIGKADTANCHIGQILAAVNGTIFAGSVTCLETPAGGEPDIDLYAATEATGTEEALASGLTETALLTAAADWAAGGTKVLTAYPAANKYLYLAASGGVTNATYTAGILLIELWGK